MKRAGFVFWITLVLLVALGGTWSWRRWGTAAGGAGSDTSRSIVAKGPVVAVSQAPAERPAVAPAREPLPPQPLTAAEKAARIERIKRDYDEITTRVSKDYTAAGKDFPGGLNAYLQQLALLQREKWKDIGALLSPRELEDMQLTETVAGGRLQLALGDTKATDEQRRETFRLLQAFNDRFALTWDVSPPALVARERARQELQAKVAGVLGTGELFAAWMRVDAEGANYGRTVEFAAQQGLPSTAPLAVLRIHDEFVLRRLEITADKNLAAEQATEARRALLEQTRRELMGVLGVAAMQVVGPDVLGWLPPKKDR